MNARKLMPPAVILAIALALPGCGKSDKAIPAGPPPSGPVELKLKWPVGSRQRQTLDLHQLVEIHLPGSSTAMTQEMTLVQDYAVLVRKERSDGGHEVQMELIGARLAGHAGNQPMDYDSAKPAANPVSATLRKLVGARILLYLDASNQVWKVEGIEDLQRRMAGGQKDPFGILNNLFNEDSLRQMMDQSRAIPTGPVAPGDSWPAKFEVAMGDLGAMDMSYTYTLKSWEKRDGHNCARIEFEGTMTGKAGPRQKISGMDLAVEGGRGAGETWFDLERGTFVDSTVTQDLKMYLSLPNQIITNIVHQSISIKRLPE